MARVLSVRSWLTPLRSALMVGALITPGLLLGLLCQRALLIWFAHR